MPDLLRTKLFTPLPPSDVISRPHLMDQLNRGANGKLSLLTAPAGYGKTTLVASWLQGLMAQKPDTQVLWLSLDDADDEIRGFLRYFIAAFCQLDGPFAGSDEAFLQEARGAFSTTAVLTGLLNRLVTFARPVLLVLDDYHVIQNASIHEALSFWLDNQPPNFHLVLTSRVEPPLPLSRLRVRRQMTQIDTDALRFSRAEAAEFLNHHMHLSLSAEDIAQLDTMTEGWIASLQLAALSLQNKDDPTRFIQTFKGDNRYIVDYLVEEVLQRQPGYIRDFLLQTSILERLNVELCNAVIGQTDSQQILETLDRTRLFIVPLDDRRHWFRYHHLFADCLRVELERTAAADIPVYHERASRWLESHGYLSEAIQHAFAADNLVFAAEQITAHARSVLWEQGASGRLYEWIQRLPDQIVASSPRLLITLAWLHLELFLENDTRVDDLLNTASDLIHAADAPYAESEKADMGIEIALGRASLSRLRGCPEEAIQFCERAVALTEQAASPLLRVGAFGSLSITHFQVGNIDRALAVGGNQLTQFEEEGPDNYGRSVFVSYMLDALRMNGQLEKAERLSRRIEFGRTHGQSMGAAMLAISRAEILREQNQLQPAIDLLIPAIDALQHLQSMNVVVQAATICLAHVYQAQGRFQEALALLKDVVWEADSRGTYYPAARVPATEALLHLRQGNLAAAREWARESGLGAEDTPTYLLEIDYLVLARILTSDGAAQAALTILTKLEEAALHGGRQARLVEVCTLQALALQTLGKKEQARKRMEQAIEIAQPAGFLRKFVDEGPALVPLLIELAGRGAALTYVRRLLSCFDPVDRVGDAALPAQQVPDEKLEAFHVPINPLTDRELVTLRYLAGDLSIPEIAQQLVVAPSTVRTYVKRIYSKLDVHSRIEAVNRGRSLALIP